ncbi:MAG: glycosyltransferase family 39 protein [Candidatus Eisenbacteria bacterium]|nr:glycosyltransferase family 39 protein [Candidatus Eisenbacteria bacterium]
MSMVRRSRHPGTVLALVAIVAVAAILRLKGIGWGLPHAYHPDEGSILIHSLGFGTGDLNPHWFRWPSLFMYVVSAMYGVYFGAGMVLRQFSSPADVVRQYVADPTPFWLIGRLASAVLGVATVWTTHRFTRRAFGQPAALIAAAFMAVMFLHVRDSHYATPDVASAFLASVSLLFAQRAISRSGSEDLLFAGFFAGLAASTKYPGAIVIVGALAAWIALRRVGAAPAWALPGTLAMLALGFVLGTPFSVLSPSEFMRDILTQVTMVSQPGVAQEASSFVAGLREIFGRTVGSGVGWPVVALALAALLVPVRFMGGAPSWSVDEREAAYATQERRAAAEGRMLAALYALAVVLVAALMTVKRSTYLTPALPAIAALAGAGLDGALAAAFSGTARGIIGRTAAAARRGPAAAFIGVALVAAVGAPSVLFVASLDRPDTRTLAKHWIERHVAAGSRVAVEDYGPVLNPTEEQLRSLIELSGTAVGSWQAPKRRLNELKLEVGAARHPQFEVYGIDWGERAHRLPNPDAAPDSLAAAIERLRVRYVVLSSKASPGRPMDGAEPPASVRPQPFVEWLGGRATRVARFADDRGAPFIDRGPGRSFHNPVIEIYEIGAKRREGTR